MFNVCAFISYPLSIGAMAFSNAYFGSGAGTILLDDVGCTGNETNLTDCTRSSTVSCISGNSEDAGVRCQGKWFDVFVCSLLSINHHLGCKLICNL